MILLNKYWHLRVENTVLKSKKFKDRSKKNNQEYLIDSVRLLLGIFFFIVVRPTKDMDIVFALSATSATADRTFIGMKNIVKALVENYGMGKVRYGLIVFGGTASIKIDLHDNLPTEEELKNLVETVPRTTGGPALDKALEEANTLFETRARPNAKKVLVVIVDNKSTSKPEDVREVAKPIHDKNVLVIAINVGESADSSDMDNLIPNKENIMSVDTTDEPKEIADDIASVIDKGRITNEYLYISRQLYKFT